MPMTKEDIRMHNLQLLSLYWLYRAHTDSGHPEEPSKHFTFAGIGKNAFSCTFTCGKLTKLATGTTKLEACENALKAAGVPVLSFADILQQKIDPMTISEAIKEQFKVYVPRPSQGRPSRPFNYAATARDRH